MEADVQKPTFINDAFISYSRKDIEFARKLEKALENYQPRKDLNVPQRNLVVFRDETDLTGAEYKESIKRHFRNWGHRNWGQIFILHFSITVSVRGKQLEFSQE